MIGLAIVAVLALVFVAAAMLLPKRVQLAPPPPPAEPEPVDVPEPEPAPPPKPADLDPQVELADLVARHNQRLKDDDLGGGRYLAINVGPSRHERRAEKARLRQVATDRGKAKRAVTR